MQEELEKNSDLSFNVTTIHVPLGKLTTLFKCFKILFIHNKPASLLELSPPEVKISNLNVYLFILPL